MNIEQSDAVTIDLKGNLLFSIAPDFERQFLITSWNQGLKFYLKTDEGWHQESIDTGLMLVCDENRNQTDEPISVFLKQLPSEVIRLVKPYRHRQFVMLQLMAQQSELIDLFRHSPTLFWMVVVQAESNSWSHAEIIIILQQKREKIIESLGGSPCKKSVRLINKLKLYTGKLSEFRLIKSCLLDSELIESFLHQKEVAIQGSCKF